MKTTFVMDRVMDRVMDGVVGRRGRRSVRERPSMVFMGLEGALGWEYLLNVTGRLYQVTGGGSAAVRSRVRSGCVTVG